MCSRHRDQPKWLKLKVQQPNSHTVPLQPECMLELTIKKQSRESAKCKPSNLHSHLAPRSPGKAEDLLQAKRNERNIESGRYTWTSAIMSLTETVNLSGSCLWRIRQASAELLCSLYFECPSYAHMCEYLVSKWWICLGRSQNLWGVEPH